jgi:hypothetical protein
MNPNELAQLIAHYRAGLDAEMKLLHRLEQLAAQQREASEQGDLDALSVATDQRDRVMAGLVQIEHELKPVRSVLLKNRSVLDASQEFQSVAALHRTAATLIERIVTDDRGSLDGLKQAEQARRLAAQSLETGESTLDAYRRVVSPTLPGAALVNRKG